MNLSEQLGFNLGLTWVQPVFWNASYAPVVNLSTGQPAVFTLTGDANDWASNFSTPFFSVQQGSGGWLSADPPVVGLCLVWAVCLFPLSPFR